MRLGLILSGISTAVQFRSCAELVEGSFPEARISKDGWSNFRRALIEKDRKAFDEMANKARSPADATTNAAHLIRWRRVLAIMLENEKELRRIGTRPWNKPSFGGAQINYSN